MADTASNGSTPSTDDKSSTPPWGDDFDASRAWTLVQNLRAEKATLQTERDDWKGKAQAAQSSTGDADSRVQAAEKAKADAEKALWVERALRKHADAGLDDYVDFLDGATEEEVQKKAERLASIGGKKEADESKANEGDKSKKDDASEKDDDDSSLPGRPTPDLTPGHGGSAPEPFDAEAIAKAAREAGSY